MPRPPHDPVAAGPDPLDEADDELVAHFDVVMDEALRRAGPLFRCHSGNPRCCRGLFPINLLDARRLVRGMTALETRDPARGQAVRRRAARVVRRIWRGFPGDPRTGLLRDDEDAERRFCARHGGMRCPALDGATGRCDVYAWRPLACRSMGPPVRLGGVDLAPCPYCFGPASEEELERCRAVPDPDGREDVVLGALETREGRRGSTLIAFALLGRPAGRI